jgi:hypothetical protein
MSKLSGLLGFSGSANAKDADFWAWFLNHKHRIEAVGSRNDRILDELLAQLHQYNEHLFFEVLTDAAQKELIITAEGNAKHLNSVRNLIAKAPKVKNWRFIAFKPPLGFDFVHNYEGVEYDPKTLWFLPLTRESKPSDIGIRIGIPNYDEQTHANSMAALWVILETGLGELSAAQDIQYMETGLLPPSPESEGYIELVELQAYLNWKKSKLK